MAVLGHMGLRAMSAVGLVITLSGCLAGEGVPVDRNAVLSSDDGGEGGSSSGGDEAGGSDAGGSDAGGSDAGGSDAGGSDAGGSDVGGSDAGGAGGAGGAPMACLEGYAMDADDHCQDVDECELAIDFCDPNETCENTEGAYLCHPPSSVPETLSIYVIDIGQGDATLVVGPAINGPPIALLMDAGDRHPDGGAIVGALLVELGITALDYVVLSHFDGDHIGGFVTISGSTSLLWHTSACDPTSFFPTNSIFDQGTDSNNTASSTQWNTCVPAIASTNNTAHRAVVGGAEIDTEIDLGGGYSATIVAGDGYVIDTPQRVPYVNTPNERSIALLVSGVDGFDFLVTGDLIGRSAGAENAKVEGALGDALYARGVDVEVLRTGHHGAANASDPDFIASIQPEVAIISTGDDQSSNYHHPRCSHYQSLADELVPLVLQTELGNSDCAQAPPLNPVVVNGTISIEVTGTNYRVRNHGTYSPANGGDTIVLDQQCTLVAGCPRTSQPAQP